MTDNRDVVRSTPGAVYVLPEYVRDRETIEPYDNACRQILERHYDILPLAVRHDFDNYLAAERKYFSTMLAWGNQFIDDVMAGIAPKDRRGRVVNDRRDWTTRMIALAAVVDAGFRGITAYEIKQQTGVVSNAIGGGLSDLHKAGLIVRLREARPSSNTA